MSQSVVRTRRTPIRSRLTAGHNGNRPVTQGARRIARSAPLTPGMRPQRINRDRLAPQVERAVFGWGLVNPILSLPQLHNIYVFKHVAGFSVVSVSAALLMAALWTTHGILGRQTVVWVTSSVWVGLNAVTLVGVVAYG